MDKKFKNPFQELTDIKKKMYKFTGKSNPEIKIKYSLWSLRDKNNG